MKDSVKGRKVFIGLSGGVDSAVSAVLLQRAGAEVTGVFIKGWYPRGMSCSWAEDRRDAMRVAAKLHIPFVTLDASEQYKKSVIDYLLAEYKVGRTPNPDVMCNRDIKFGVFYLYAKSQGADYIATGHYRAGEKDQTYFLWAVPKEVLETTLFPVGGMDKKEVRALARRFNLPVAHKKDSQGVCFLGSVSVADFLERELNTTNPALLYTLGQRVPLPDGPWYVVEKDVKKSEIKVSKTREGGAEEIFFRESNWFLSPSTVTHAQYRYRGPRVEGVVVGDRFVSAVPLSEAPAPGQSVVFYKGQDIAGGGTIST